MTCTIAVVNVILLEKIDNRNMVVIRLLVATRARP